jgi:hypothetical protein
MTRFTKLIMILFAVVSFSCGIVNFMAMFSLPNPKIYAVMSLVSFIVSWAINQEILDEENDKISEIDETF